MILPDANVLIYAFRRDTPQHTTAKSWLESTLEREGQCGISPVTLSSLVRITTNPHVFCTPSAIEDAVAFCDTVLGLPHCRVVEPGEHHWEIFRRLCVETQTTGPGVTDAWLAALAIEWGCEWITFDKDFARFPGLRWRMPSAGAV